MTSWRAARSMSNAGVVAWAARYAVRSRHVGNAVRNAGREVGGRVGAVEAGHRGPLSLKRVDEIGEDVVLLA